jgi:hypothetical protein
MGRSEAGHWEVGLWEAGRMDGLPVDLVMLKVRVAS